LRHQVEDAQHLRPIAHHLAIANLPPAQHAIAVDDEARAPGHVAGFIEDAVGSDDGTMDIAQQWEGEPLSLGEGGV
jgi:hypothetical protein